MPRLGEKIPDRRQQIRTQTSPFLPDGFEVPPFEQPREKSLSKVLCFLWLIPFASDEPVHWPPVDSAELFQRLIGGRRSTLRRPNHAPMCCGKTDWPVPRACTNASQW